jgi:uncharacterized protein (DUF433 family)
MDAHIIESSVDVLGGTPVFRGTRVPFQNLIDYLESGDTINQFLEDYPSVSREAVIQFLELAKNEVLAS